MIRNRCEHGYVIDPADLCPECERDSLRTTVVDLLGQVGQLSEECTHLRARVAELEEAAMWAIDHVSRFNSPERISEAKAHVRAALKEGEGNER